MTDRKNRRLLFLFFLIFSSTIIQAGSRLKEMNAKASQLYQEGNYAASLDIWYQMMKAGYTDANLYFNIGNAEAIQGHIPQSLLAFEKAHRIRPADHEIQEAIKKERGKIENGVIPVSPFFLSEWYRFGLALLRPGGWVFVGLMILLLVLIQRLIPMTNPPGFFKKINNWFFILAGLLIIIIGFLSYHQLHRKDEAIVMVSCDCRQAPSTESPLARRLEAGEKVRIIDEISTWNKVRLLNLDEGWIEVGCLTLIGTSPSH